MTNFNLSVIDPSWREGVERSLEQLDPAYVQTLKESHDWLPGHEQLFNAFSLALPNVNYILFGESPYPRKESANGYAFWDANVKALWSDKGFSKTVNRATSLRNLLKLLLIAEGLLSENDTSQEAITRITKSGLVETGDQLFSNFLKSGILLLNATLVLQPTSKIKEAVQWQPFIKELLSYAIRQKPDIQFILLGKIANTIDQLFPHHGIQRLYAEHPYNISFIQNRKIRDFFKPFHLLKK